MVPDNYISILLRGAIQEYLLHAAKPNYGPASSPPPRPPLVLAGGVRPHQDNSHASAYLVPARAAHPDSFTFAPRNRAIYGLRRSSETAALQASDLEPGRLALQQRDRATCWRHHPICCPLAHLISNIPVHQSHPVLPSPPVPSATFPRIPLHLARPQASGRCNIGPTRDHPDSGRWASSQSARTYFELQQPFHIYPPQQIHP